MRQGIINKRWFPALQFFLLMQSQVSLAQVTASLNADSSHIMIGDFLNLKLTVKFPGDVSIIMPRVADTIGNLELISASKIDTAVNASFRTVSQTYVVSAYDSGRFHAGPQKILFKNASGALDSIFSDSVLIAVTTLAVDTAKAFKPIKNPIDVPYTFSEFIPYIVAAVVLAAIIVSLVYYARERRKRNPKVIERPKPKEPAHIWARKELKKLDEEKLWQKEQIKLYYSRLTDILRLYLEYRYGWFALESTTEEIQDQIGAYGIDVGAQKELLTILAEADLVKFAKKMPMPDVNTRMMELAFHFIDLTQPAEITTEKIHA